MKATFRGSSKINLKHNDHDEKKKNDGHIDHSKSHLNQIATCMDSDEESYSVYDGTLKFYEMKFGDTLKKQNEKYIKVGGKNSKRIRTMEEWMKGSMHRPHEIILQVGSEATGGCKDPETLNNMIDEYVDWKQERFKGFVTVISVAGHFDEGATNGIQRESFIPEYHIQEIWHYKDEDGLYQTGIKETLKRANVPLPYPDKSESAKNYRMVTVDKECREKWYDIVESYGFDIDRTPAKSDIPYLSPKQQRKVSETVKGHVTSLNSQIQRSKQQETILNEQIERVKLKEVDLDTRLEALEASNLEFKAKLEQKHKERAEAVLKRELEALQNTLYNEFDKRVDEAANKRTEEMRKTYMNLQNTNEQIKQNEKIPDYLKGLDRLNQFI